MTQPSAVPLACQPHADDPTRLAQLLHSFELGASDRFLFVERLDELSAE